VTPTGDDGLARLAALKVLIVHDWIMGWAGSERVVEQLLVLFPRADLVVGVMGEGIRGLNDTTSRAAETWLARLPLARHHHRWFLPLYAAAFAGVDTRGYDLVVSSSHAFAKSVRVDGNTPHLCYCHSPPRYLWDLERAYRRGGGLAGVALGLAASTLRRIDRAGAERVDLFVANSRYIADRIQRCYGRDAAVVHPPVSAKPAQRSKGRTDALLSLGRLVGYKRVDLAVKAANALGARLVVAGEGPERDVLERFAGPTVEFLGAVSEAGAGELMETCRAMLFCGEEDFGIAPVEANLHGLPVVAYGRGGVLESMVNDVTALFFHSPTASAIVRAVDRLAAVQWDDAAIRANGLRFAPARFRAGLAAQAFRLL
jgi:glycosyltransferase involved in cell wall biosynthesis